MATFIIFLTACVFVTQAQDHSLAPGSGSNSCLPLTSDHPCYNLTNRGSNYALPQMLPVDVNVTNLFGFFLSSGTETTDPQECQEAIVHYMCLLAAPPCDPVSHQPLLICDRSCEAYNTLTAGGACNGTVDAARQYADDFDNDDIFESLELYDAFDCENVSTYYYFEVDMSADRGMCTNLLNKEYEESVLSQNPCVEVTNQICAAIYPMPYFIEVEERLEGDIFADVSALSRELGLFCRDTLVTFSCAYLYPACNPERGTQLVICSDSCSLLDMVKVKCDEEQSKIAIEDDMRPFLQYLANFNCSNPQSYLIPGVPVDTEECIPANELFNISEEDTDNSDPVSRILAIVFGSLGALLVLSLAVVVIVCLYRRRNLKTVYYRQWAFSMERRNKLVRMREMRDMKDQSAAVSASTMDVGNEYKNGEKEVKLSQADVKKYESQFSGFLFHYANLQLKEIIGEGAFGRVYFSILNDHERLMTDTQVAIKTIKNVKSEEQLKEFLAESLLMKDFHHPHVLGLLGVCFDTPDGSPYIVLPYMANGSLKKYLKDKRAHILDTNSYPKGLPLETLTRMCMDIAEGMTYLAEHKFVHRDLAARNCMLNSELSVLVGDFGLARDVYVSDYYRTGKGAKLPVKWMPPEALQDGISNEKTDVWSYGVTCWEVFSLGQIPYPGIENHEILDYITSEGRPNKPSLCTEKLYTVLSQCWYYLPEERPSFKQIVSSLKEYWDEEHFYMVQSFSR